MLSENSPSYKRVLALIQANLYEICRTPAYFISVVFFGVAIYISRHLTFFTFTEQNKVATIRDIGLSSMVLCGLWIIFYAGVQLVTREIETKTTYPLFSKPVSRRDFILGKYGSIFISAMISSVILLFVLIYTLSSGDFSSTPGGKPPTFSLNSIVSATLLIALELSVLSAIVLFLTTLFTPLITLVFTLLFFTLGHLHPYLYKSALAHLSPEGVGLAMTYILYGLSVVLPDLETFNITADLAARRSIPGSYFVMATAYGVMYTAAILTITFLQFEQKEL